MDYKGGFFDTNDQALFDFLERANLEKINAVINSDVKSLWTAFIWSKSEEALSGPEGGLYWLRIYSERIPIDGIAIAKLERYALFCRLFK